MTGIQLLLICGVLLIVIYFILELRSAAIDLLVVLLATGLAIFFILAPENTSVIAKKIGVGRGADLLFYCCILFFLFTILKLFARIRRLEDKVTEMVREQAKKDAVYLTKEH